eukprot:scaffold273695_cov31-Tisochrysis_lutea.AAC.1
MILTSNLFDDSFPNLVFALVVILGSSFLLIEQWGEVEAGRYLLLVGVLQASFSWVAMVTLYILFREHHFLFARLAGLSGLVGGLSVAVAQQIMVAPSSVPAQLVIPLRYAPLCAFSWSLVLLLFVHAGPPDEIFFCAFGILSGWTYLRYYQPKPGDSFLRPAVPTGDSSDSFSFASLWPPAVQPPMRLVGTALYGVLSSCCCGLFPPTASVSDDSVLGGLGGMNASAHVGQRAAYSPLWYDPVRGDVEAPPPPPSVTTADPLVAERRRQRARELLEQRMAAKVANNVQASPLTHSEAGLPKST